jgi:hypothetical protein
VEGGPCQERSRASVRKETYSRGGSTRKVGAAISLSSVMCFVTFSFSAASSWSLNSFIAKENIQTGHQTAEREY